MYGTSEETYRRGRRVVRCRSSRLTRSPDRPFGVDRSRTTTAERLPPDPAVWAPMEGCRPRRLGRHRVRQPWGRWWFRFVSGRRRLTEPGPVAVDDGRGHRLEDGLCPALGPFRSVVVAMCQQGFEPFPRTSTDSAGTSTPSILASVDCQRATAPLGSSSWSWHGREWVPRPCSHRFAYRASASIAHCSAVYGSSSASSVRARSSRPPRCPPSGPADVDSCRQDRQSVLALTALCSGPIRSNRSGAPGPGKSGPYFRRTRRRCRGPASAGPRS